MQPFLALIACLLPGDDQIVNPNDSAQNASLMTKADEYLKLARPMSDNMHIKMAEDYLAKTHS